jgi:hypothetical protein
MVSPSMCRFTGAAVLAAALLQPAAAFAQHNGIALAEVLPELLGRTIILNPTALPDQPNHRAHFAPGFDQLEVPGQFNRAVLTLLSTSPIASPSGGFTYTSIRRSAPSAAPATASGRPLPSGRSPSARARSASASATSTPPTTPSKG